MLAALDETARLDTRDCLCRARTLAREFHFRLVREAAFAGAPITPSISLLFDCHRFVESVGSWSRCASCKETPDA